MIIESPNSGTRKANPVTATPQIITKNIKCEILQNETFSCFFMFVSKVNRNYNEMKWNEMKVFIFWQTI